MNFRENIQLTIHKIKSQTQFIFFISCIIWEWKQKTLLITLNINDIFHSRISSLPKEKIEEFRTRIDQFQIHGIPVPDNPTLNTQPSDPEIFIPDLSRPPPVPLFGAPIPQAQHQVFRQGYQVLCQGYQVLCQGYQVLRQRCLVFSNGIRYYDWDIKYLVRDIKFIVRDIWS